LAVYRALGLSADDGGGATTFASLTPVKEREVDLLMPVPAGETTLEALRRLAAPLYHLLDVALHTWGGSAFNVAVFWPPVAAPREWKDFPLVARFVDRGNPLSTTADVAALELFGSSVVASDPFDVARSLRGQRAARRGH